MLHHAGGAAHRAQPPFRGYRLPGNFNSGFPGYRGKLSKDAGTLPEILRVTATGPTWSASGTRHPLTETGAAGPLDGWPLGRGFDRYYGFMDAETDQYSPELVRDNTPVEPPASYEEGYHLTADLVDQSIRFVADHIADQPDKPWLLWLAFGLPRAAPGAEGHHRELRRRFR